MILITPNNPSGGGSSNWWEAGTGTPSAYAVHEAENASSKANSLTDLTGNGRSLTETGTVTWASGTGWSGWSEDTNYLITDSGVVAHSDWSMVVICDLSTTDNEAAFAVNAIMGGNALGDTRFSVYGSGNRYGFEYHDNDGTRPAVEPEALGLVGSNGTASALAAYIEVGTTTVSYYFDTGETSTFSTTQPIYIGARNNNGTVTQGSKDAMVVKRVAFYDAHLTKAQLEAVMLAGQAE